MQPKTLTLVLGDQLFQEHPALSSDTDYLMIENPLDCATTKNLHKQKIIFFLASMRNYASFLETKLKPDQKIHYSTLLDNHNFESRLIELSKQYSHIQFCSISDKAFRASVLEICHQYFGQVTVLPSLSFLTSSEDFQNYLDTRTTKGLIMANFYTWQRKRLEILVDSSNKPIGGKWSYDADNRKALPKNYQFREHLKPQDNTTWHQVKAEVEKYLPSSYGKAQECYLATTHAEVELILEDFIENFLKDFGDYEDAMTTQDNWVNHSILSPYLNCGLLTPKQILSKLTQKLENQPDLIEKLASVEGYIRQLIGWREWVKGMYDTQYKTIISQYNFFGATKPLPRYFWFENLEELENIPLKEVLIKVRDFGYAHHIERLMILANWMTLSGYDPVESLDWFSSMFVDALDWVMVPNVIGMGLYADGGIFATKPYVSSSNYILKMSNYAKGDWTTEWDDLFWDFLMTNDKFFESQPRMNMLIKSRKKKLGID